ncbi:unnamed protein product, partial [Scytosiphon promiscuus]
MPLGVYGSVSPVCGVFRGNEVPCVCAFVLCMKRGAVYFLRACRCSLCPAVFSLPLSTRAGQAGKLNVGVCVHFRSCMLGAVCRCDGGAGTSSAFARTPNPQTM